MEAVEKGRELFLKAFVMSLIKNTDLQIRKEFTLTGQEVADNISKQYVSQNIPILQIPREIIERNYGNLIENASSTHEVDLIGKKINSFIQQKQAQPARPIRLFPAARAQMNLGPQNMPLHSQPTEVAAPQNEPDYELTEIKSPRQVTIQEVPSGEDSSQLQIGIGQSGGEKIQGNNLEKPVRIESMRLERIPAPQINRPNPNFQRGAPPRQFGPAMQGNMQRPSAPPSRPKQMPSILEELTIFGFNKLDELIQDPNIESVECPGPDKPLLVSKRGKIQPTAISLNAEEIDRIMREISDRTRIPLTTGIFRAAVGRYIITSVLSEFVGTRFIIQKKPVSTQ